MVTAGSASPRGREGFLKGGALNLLENSRDGSKMVVGVQEEEKKTADPIRNKVTECGGGEGREP